MLDLEHRSSPSIINAGQEKSNGSSSSDEEFEKKSPKKKPKISPRGKVSTVHVKFVTKNDGGQHWC